MTELEIADAAIPTDRNLRAIWQGWWTVVDGTLEETVSDAAAPDLAGNLAHFGAPFDERLQVVDFACENGKQTRFLGRLSTEGVVSIISPAEGGDS